jgi:hypothetical protein
VFGLVGWPSLSLCCHPTNCFPWPHHSFYYFLLLLLSGQGQQGQRARQSRPPGQGLYTEDGKSLLCLFFILAASSTCACLLCPFLSVSLCFSVSLSLSLSFSLVLSLSLSLSLSLFLSFFLFFSFYSLSLSYNNSSNSSRCSNAPFTDFPNRSVSMRHLLFPMERIHSLCVTA